jgi:hypothetical protein
MHVALGDSAAPPLVEILHERMGSEAQDRAQLKESKITAVFDKYKVSDLLPFPVSRRTLSPLPIPACNLFTPPVTSSPRL